ncbi:MAG: M56 family metallopeptidase, partial [Planctomycetota bacterium]|nr:M56 family metallopeptidase [Planctomycetota bacterium]
MIDFLVAATLNNLLVSTILAVLATLVQQRFSAPGLTSLLWALVLIKMVTPPVFAIPALAVPRLDSSNVPTAVSLCAVESPLPVDPIDMDSSGTMSGSEVHGIVADSSDEASRMAMSRADLLGLGMVVWGLVSSLLLLVSAARLLRFHRLLVSTASVDRELTRGLAASVACQLGIQKQPDVVVTSANIAPFVWWRAGHSVVVISRHVIEDLDQADLRLIITHEMAHIKRYDHWFRWLEWMALIVFWWNPVMWWSRRQLRLSEEMACDQLVLRTVNVRVNQYASSLLNVAALVASSEIRPPDVASAINSGGSLEKRLKLIMNGNCQVAPAALRTAVLGMAMCVFPLGVVYAKDFGAFELRLKAAVDAGEISQGQAKILMDTLRRSSLRTREMDANKQNYQRALRAIEEAHEAGEISEEEVEKRVLELRRESFKRERDGEVDVESGELAKQRYQRALRAIEEAHEAGEMSEEEVEKRVLGLRRELFKRERDEDVDIESGELAKQRYQRALRAIEEAHEAGEMSEEEVEKRVL